MIPLPRRSLDPPTLLRMPCLDDGWVQPPQPVIEQLTMWARETRLRWMRWFALWRVCLVWWVTVSARVHLARLRRGTRCRSDDLFSGGHVPGAPVYVHRARRSTAGSATSSRRSDLVRRRRPLQPTLLPAPRTTREATPPATRRPPPSPPASCPPVTCLRWPMPCRYCSTSPEN